MVLREASAAKIGSVRDMRRAESVVARRKALGFFSRNSFVTASGLGRDRVRSAEEGTARPASYDEIEAWLDAAEAAAGITRAAVVPEPRPNGDVGEPSDAGTVTFQLRGNFGVDVTVKGPVQNLDELEEKVERLLARMERPGADGGPDVKSQPS